MVEKRLQEQERRSCHALSPFAAAVAPTRFLDLKILPAVLPLLPEWCGRQCVRDTARVPFLREPAARVGGAVGSAAFEILWEGLVISIFMEGIGDFDIYGRDWLDSYFWPG